MKVFRVCCVDTKTGLEVIASECSYNHAMSYLYSKLGEPLFVTPQEDGTINVEFKHDLLFKYDECRGVLLCY